MAEDLKHALQIARNAAMNWYYKEHDHKHIVEYRTGDMPDAIVLALARAGLLVTPAMERAVEACERVARYKPESYMPDWREVVEAGIEVRAERAAREKPRYYAIPETSGIRVCGCGVMDRDEGNPFYAPGNGFTLKQAEAVAEALNRETRP